MIDNPDCKFAGLINIPDEELDEVLRAMLNSGFVERKPDGFYPTEKGRGLLGV
jgi:hypothetical protein